MNLLQMLYEKISHVTELVLRKVCPFLYYVVLSKKGQHNKLKKCCGFVYGLLLGLGFYELIIVDLDFTAWSAAVVGGVLSVMLGVGIAISSQIRCIALLCLPSFAGKAGRSVLKALVLAYLVAGPLANLATNGRQVAHLFSCTTSLTFNLTKTRFELMFKPFRDAVLGLKSEGFEVKDTVRSIRDVTAPIAGEVEGEQEMKKMKEENDYMDEFLQDSKRTSDIDKKYNVTGEEVEAERHRKQYLKKIETRCEDQLTRAGGKCNENFAKTYDKCYEKVTWIAAWLLCWPMKLNFVCNIVGAIGGSKTCDPSQNVDPGIGEGYTYLKHSRQDLTQNFKDVKLQYKIGKIQQLQDIREATDVAKTVLHSVKQKKTFMVSMLQILKRILAFVILRIIMDAQNYHDKYLRDIDFDNIYVTNYFRRIDSRRKAVQRRTLLPLKKVERLKVVEPWRLRPLPSEREEMIGQTVRLLLEMVTASVFVLLDWLLYAALDLVRRHARIDYMQTGHHHMSLQVLGTGLIANLLRKVTKGFNIRKSIKVVRSNAACLPKPSLLPHYYLYKIYGTYLAIWVLVMVQAYIRRLRRAICGFYYPKREKRRVLYLYNETLKRRIGFMRYMKKKIKSAAIQDRLEQELNVFRVLRVRFPKYFEWLRLFAFARRKCIVCGEREPLSRKAGEFIRCMTEQCLALYCGECWSDVAGVCYACSPPSLGHSDSSGSGDDM